MNLDREFYIVISELPNCSSLVLETETWRMSREQTEEDLRHGQFGTVHHVITFNPVEHTCREVTDEFEYIIRECNALIERNRS